jgi:hypothetical protein
MKNVEYVYEIDRMFHSTESQKFEVIFCSVTQQIKSSDGYCPLFNGSRATNEIITAATRRFARQ